MKMEVSFLNLLEQENKLVETLNKQQDSLNQEKANFENAIHNFRIKVKEWCGKGYEKVVQDYASEKIAEMNKLLEDIQLTHLALRAHRKVMKAYFQNM